ncbi:MAG: hypothetical protein JWN86_2386 [Planctomycetota bacterium]|nr:hypothetical protein [Planctomycetota bacterium]
MRTLLLAFAGLLAIGLAATADDESNAVLTGDDLSQLRLVGFGPETISIKDKEIRLTGKPNGYFATKQSYKNYVLKFEWMYERPAGYKDGDKFNGNSGVLVHLVPPDKVWPKCIEVQLAYAEAGHIFAINGAKFTGKTDRDALKKSMKPVGEWNEQEIICKDGVMTCTVNGVTVASGSGASPDEGTIGFQAEGSPIRFRFLRIKKMN